MTPKVSVVIPLYNKAPYIMRSLRSVLAQSYQNFEIVVVDDGSTDGGGDIVLSVGDPCIRLIRQENGGVSAARNRGIQEAKADLIAFLDADDEWKPSFLELILDMYSNYPDAGLYGTCYEFHGSATSIG
ncbi:MAG: glycosyltransferase family 2 protein, partial [Clostridiaceae bacterium]|nr:glycosyltransferase family 2 protein [Clostridiaceae bacterium]